MSSSAIHEPDALAAEIDVDRMQRAPQLARWHAFRATTALALEDVHDLADPI